MLRAKSAAERRGTKHTRKENMAMVHNLWLHFGADEHPLATDFDVHQGFPGF